MFRKRRQLGDDVLGDAVAEIFLVDIAGHVGERQHRDRGYRRRSCGSVALMLQSALITGDAECVHRSLDVLQRAFTHVMELDGQLVADVVANRAGYDDAAFWRDALQPGSDIHAVAVDVGSFEDHLPQVYSNAQDDAFGRGLVQIGLIELPLQFDRALNTVGRAGEFDQDAVAHQLEYPPTVLGDQRRKDVPPLFLEDREGAYLVHLHEAGIADDIRGQNRRESTLNALFDHAV